MTLVTWNEANEPQGIFIALLESAAEANGWELDYRTGSFASLMDQLEDGELDMLPAVAVSYKRLKKYSFTRLPVIENWAVLYRKDGVVLNNIFDLKDKRIFAVEADIHLEALLQKIERYRVECEVVTVDTYGDAMKRLESGDGDAALVSRTFSTLEVSKYTSISTLLIFNPIPLHYAVKKNMHYDAIYALDNELAAQKEDPNSALQQSMDTWLKADKHFVIPQWIYYCALVLLLLVVGLLIFIRILRLVVASRTRELEIEKTKSEKALRSQNLFLGTLSHELRTPLNFITCSLDLLKDEIGDQSKMGESIEHFDQGVQRLEHLFISLLRFADVERDEFVLMSQKVVLSELFEEIFRMSSSLRRGADVSLNREFLFDNKLRVKADEDALFQIALNLLHNSIKYTESGHVNFRVTAEEMVSRVRLTIIVEDSGIGIPESDKDEILVPFKRGTEGHFVESGAGLGLSIVKRLLELLGGTLEIKSTVGEGSRFEVNLDLEAVVD